MQRNEQVRGGRGKRSGITLIQQCCVCVTRKGRVFLVIKISELLYHEIENKYTWNKRVIFLVSTLVHNDVYIPLDAICSVE